MDKITINRKYNYLLDRLDKLNKYLKEYENRDDKELIYLALQRITEEVVETAIKLNIFILKENKIFPKTYQDSFLLLKKIFDLDKEEIENLSNTAKFRNILAHEYIELKEKEFIENSKKIIEIYPNYLKIIYKSIK